MGSVNFLKTLLLGIASFLLVGLVAIAFYPQNALGPEITVYGLIALVIIFIVMWFVPGFKGMFLAEMLELVCILGFGATAFYVVVRPEIIAKVKTEIPSQVVPPDSGEDGGKKVTPTPPSGGEEAKTTTPEPEEQPLSAERLRALGITTDE